MGEIEVLPDSSLCVRCPWHSWKFSLQNGKCITGVLDGNVRLSTYPIKIEYETGRLSAGFQTLCKDYFQEPTF